jgi:DNA repair protein SbcD/Mre11
VKLLHTSDWHVGKAMRGQSRADEHEAVLGEITRIAADEAVDVVLVTGDLFETSAPSPESEAIVYRHLLALAATGAKVVVIAGNHDNPRRLAAVTPLLELGQVTLLAEPARSTEGGVLRFTTDAGQAVNLALLPFVSQRGIVRADDLMGGQAVDHSATYAERLRRLVGHLTEGLDGGDAVNLLAAHAMVAGGVLGGGERSAHTIFQYALPASAFPAGLHYVALGHLHRTQEVPAACPAWYAGSPLQLDFGEEADHKAVLVVEAEPGSPAHVRPVTLAAGRNLRTLKGSLLELRAWAGDVGDDWLRVEVDEPARAGLADEVREILPNAVQVSARPVEAPDGRAGAARLGRSPDELFAEYLAEQDVADDRLVALFRELHDELSEADDAA